MLIRNVDVNGRLCDVRIMDGLITEIGRNLTGDHDFDGQGGALVPGLHDHHIHLNASAAAMNSVKCGPPDVKDEIGLIAALHGDLGEGPLRGVGYHQSVAGDIDRDWLDKNGPARPVRIQHRSGRLWILNSLALDMVKADVPADGRLFDDDTALEPVWSSFYPDLKPLVNRLLSFGITGVTEVTPRNGLAEFAHYVSRTAPLKLSIMGRPELSGCDGARVGPVKFHYHEDSLPPLAQFVSEIESAHQSGRNVAAHCVTRAELMLFLSALEEAGAKPGDRIEHAAIVDEFMLEWMRRLDVTIVTQPNFITERGEAYAKDVPQRDHANLWRLKSLMDAGLKVAAGSDAPFGDANPWTGMASAVNRSFGFVDIEGITPEAALGLYTKPASGAGTPPRRIEVGEVADLCLLDQPWKDARQNIAGVNVRATWIDGQLVYEAVDKPPL